MMFRGIYLFAFACLLSVLGIVKAKVIPATKVAIAGAGSSVGLAVFKKLYHGKDFQPIGLVRDRSGFDGI